MNFQSRVQTDHDLWRIERAAAFDTKATARDARIGTARSRFNPDNALHVARDLYASLDIEDDRLAEDASDLATAFAQLAPDRALELRIDVSDKTTCPKFHYDNRYIRLVTTYCGPTTQYKETSGDGRISQAAPWELLLLKGGAHPTFAQRVVHRSPPMTRDQRRLVLVIDC